MRSFQYLSVPILLVAFLSSCGGSAKASSEGADDLQVVAQIQPGNVEVFIRAFKQEKELECWVKKREAVKWELLKTYPICKSSGDLGPKRRQGDGQVPEGVYHIDRFNPNSSYHLSLGLNYPNASDRVRGHSQTPGGDIFIHGNCVTVGCLPLTDALIEEVYELSELAKAGGQTEIPVHIFPARMEGRAYREMIEDSPHRQFWEELRPIYAYFETNHRLPEVRILPDGRYQLVPE